MSSPTFAAIVVGTVADKDATTEPDSNLASNVGWENFEDARSKVSDMTMSKTTIGSNTKPTVSVVTGSVTVLTPGFNSPVSKHDATPTLLLFS